MSVPRISEYETEIGLKPEGDHIVFCKYQDGLGYWDLIVSFSFDAMGEWIINQIDVEEYNRGKKTRHKLEGKVFEAARDFLYRSDRMHLEDHVYNCVGEIKPMWAA